MSSTPTFGPFASGPGANLGQDDYFDYLAPMLQGNGVNSTDFSGTDLTVYADNSGLQVRVRPGSALVRGVMFKTDEDIIVPIAPNPSVSTRIDRVVLTMDRAAETLEPTVIQGTPGSGPPALQVQNGFGLFQITLAQVQVGPNAGGITPSDVSDERQFLPLKIKVVDSRYSYTMPPADDGILGWLFYDKNPAVNGLIETNGTSWSKVWTKSDVDAETSSWNDLGTTGGFVGYYGGTRWRRRGQMVELRAHILGTHNDATITAFPVGLSPDDDLYVPVYCTDGTSDWYIRIPGATWGGSVPLQLVGLHGNTDPTNKSFFISHTYFAG